MAVKQKILAVDDNSTNLLLYEELLGEDYDLLTAASGEEALVSVFENNPDLILLDIMMPGLDGYEVTRRLRASNKSSELKIILVSAKNTTDDRLTGYESGADDYLIKPFDEDELKAKMDVYLKLLSVQELDKFKTDVIEIFNHETRTPLNGIAGPLELLKSKNETSTAAERLQWFEAMDLSIRELNDFIFKALQLSELRAGKYLMGQEQIYVSDLIKEAIEELGAMMSDRGVEVEVLGKMDIKIPGDRKLIYQCIFELVKNAVQYSEADSKVGITLLEQSSDMSMTIHNQNHGQSIDWKILPQLFDGVVKPDSESGQPRKSLSLAIVKEVALLHQGSVSAVSKSNDGTEFTLQLPLAS